MGTTRSYGLHSTRLARETCKMDNVSELMKYSTPEIKSIAPVAFVEMHTSKLATSLLARISASKRYKFVFDVNGTLVERTYGHSFSNEYHDVVTEGSYNRLVKIHLVDGSCKLGIVGFSLENRTIGRKLMSLYVRKLRNPNTGEWDWPGTLYKYEALEEPLCEKLKFYGEDMEKVVETKGSHKPKLNVGTMEEYYRLYWFMNSNYIKDQGCFNKWVEVQPMGKMPEDLDGFHRIDTRKPNYVVPPIGYEKWNGLPPVFMTFTRAKYLKSIYKDVKTKVLHKEVFYLDDLLMICEYSLDSEDGLKMVWSSLDETCRGNVSQ